jgi:pimeloyl-ACP methyl ester carboxylesterase
MSKRVSAAIMAAVGLSLTAVSAHAATKGGYAFVNGINLYYVIYGTGQSLVLLHGGLGSLEMFDPSLPVLSASRQVIAVDLQAHGRTADIDRPLRFELMADDIAALIKHLGIERADVMGYSLGGGVALQTAIRHPEVARKLVVVSTPFKRDGWYPEVLAAMAQMGPEAAESMKQSPIYQLYSTIAPRPQDWPVLVTKMGDLMKRGYDWTKGVTGIKAPVLIVFGDADAVRTAHALEFFALLGGGQRDAGWDGAGRPKAQLAILPGVTHYDIYRSPALWSTAIQFLDAPMPEGK